MGPRVGAGELEGGVRPDRSGRPTPLHRALRRERRVARRLEALGEEGLAEALLGLNGVIVGGRYRLEALYAVGAEGAVFLTSDVRSAASAPRVAKVPLLPYHRPAVLDGRTIRRRRAALRAEAEHLRDSASPYLPQYHALTEFRNPLLDPSRGGAFAEAELALLMEKLPGRDLDRWLARAHRSGLPRTPMRRTVDRAAVVLLQGLVDLLDRGYVYADLRPGNLRILGQPDRVLRLLDAGSLVPLGSAPGRFPHVPAYLPPALFRDLSEGRPITASEAAQAVMAGRTLFEIATGDVPRVGEEVDADRLRDAPVSPPVAEAVVALCRGEHSRVHEALDHLAARAAKRVAGGIDLRAASQPTLRCPAAPVRRAAAVPGARMPAARPFPDWTAVRAWIRRVLRRPAQA